MVVVIVVVMVVVMAVVTVVAMVVVTVVVSVIIIVVIVVVVTVESDTTYLNLKSRRYGDPEIFANEEGKPSELKGTHIKFIEVLKRKTTKKK